jgi:hypothetical protein
MGFTAQAAADMLDAVRSGITKLEIYTAGYGTKLVEFNITFGSATVALPSVITVGSTPISATGITNGTAGSFRVVTNSATRWEATGSTAVGLADAMVVLTNLSIGDGQAVQLLGCTLSFDGTLLPES